METMVAQAAVVVSVTIQPITVDQATHLRLLRHRAAMVVRDMRGLGQAAVVEAIQPMVRTLLAELVVLVEQDQRATESPQRLQPMQVVAAATVQAPRGQAVQAVEAVACHPAAARVAVVLRTQAVAVLPVIPQAALAVRALSSSDTRWPHNG